ncbi:hypothetical protein ES703_114457 [subsurface metagenome]
MNIEEWEERGLVSPSDMNSFLPPIGCPLKWKLKKEGRGGIPVDRGRAMLGSNIHHMIKTYFQHISDKPSEAEIKRIAENVYEEGFNKGQLSGLKKRAERCWKNFVAFELNRRKTWKVYKPDVIEEKLSGAGFIGIIDFHSNRQATTIDWKSGNLNQLGDEQLRQGKVYKILLENNGHKTGRVLFSALYTGRILEMPLVTDGWVERERNKMVTMVRKRQLTKSPGRLCDKWCPYLLECEMSGVCLWV